MEFLTVLRQEKDLLEGRRQTLLACIEIAVAQLETSRHDLKAVEAKLRVMEPAILLYARDPAALVAYGVIDPGEKDDARSSGAIDGDPRRREGDRGQSGADVHGAAGALSDPLPAEAVGADQTRPAPVVSAAEEPAAETREQRAERDLRAQRAAEKQRRIEDRAAPVGEADGDRAEAVTAPAAETPSPAEAGQADRPDMVADGAPWLEDPAPEQAAPAPVAEPDHDAVPVVAGPSVEFGGRPKPVTEALGSGRDASLNRQTKPEGEAKLHGGSPAQQLADQIVADIGTLLKKFRFGPTASELAAHYKVSPARAKDAMRELYTLGAKVPVQISGSGSQQCVRRREGSALREVSAAPVPGPEKDAAAVLQVLDISSNSRREVSLGYSEISIETGIPANKVPEVLGRLVAQKKLEMVSPAKGRGAVTYRIL